MRRLGLRREDVSNSFLRVMDLFIIDAEMDLESFALMPYIPLEIIENAGMNEDHSLKSKWLFSSDFVKRGYGRSWLSRNIVAYIFFEFLRLNLVVNRL